MWATKAKYSTLFINAGTISFTFFGLKKVRDLFVSDNTVTLKAHHIVHTANYAIRNQVSSTL